MKVKIGPYLNWWGPYQIAEKLLFWKDKDDPKVLKLAEWLSEDSDMEDSRLTKFCQWIYSKRNRTVKIRIDPYDTWSMDSTLAMIVLPMLIQLKETKHGAPSVDDSDVPEELRSTAAPPKKSEFDIDDNHFKRWNWVLSEMIWAFTQIQPETDWESQYHTGVHETIWIPSDKKDENGEPLTYEMAKGPNDTSQFDMDGYQAHDNRISNGLILFGKYYRGLWD